MVIDFYVKRCRVCKVVLPLIIKVMNEHENKIHVIKVDVKDNNEIAMEYGTPLNDIIL